jgi:hypothetical protein
MESTSKKKEKSQLEEEEKVLTYDIVKDESKLALPPNQPAYNKENNNYNLLTFLTSRNKPDIYFGGEVIKARHYKIKTGEIKEGSGDTSSEGDNVADLRKKEFRYFQTNNITIRCFNCDEVGHIARNCPNEVIKSCTRCNEPGHDDTNCPNVKCFKCNRIGHRSYECKASRDIEKCINCKNVGHTAEDCLSKPTPITVKDLERYKLSICRFCGKQGHLICPFPKTPFIIDDYISDHVVVSDEDKMDVDKDDEEDKQKALPHQKMTTFKEIIEYRSREKETNKTIKPKKKRNYSNVVFCPNCAERHRRENCTQTGRSNEFDQRRQVHSRNMFRNDTNVYKK